MPITIETATGRNCWASYLINGDESGLEPNEIKAADKFAAFHGGNCVSCTDETYFAIPDCPGETLPGDCCDYIFHIRSV